MGIVIGITPKYVEKNTFSMIEHYKVVDIM